MNDPDSRPYALVGDDRRIPVIACVLLVTLRLSIGWHLLYEGWWKLTTLTTPTPWTAEGYLKNATGPFRHVFRNLTGDPNDLRWLDYDQVAAGWDDWHARFVRHYPGFAGSPQAEQLDRLLNGSSQFVAPLAALPPGVTPQNFEKRPVSWDAANKRLVVDGKQHLLAAERDYFLNLVKAAEGDSPEVKASKEAFAKAINSLYNQSAKLSFKERLAVLNKADPERVGVEVKDKDGKVIENRLGDMQLYREQIKRYDAAAAKAKTDFEHDHLDRQWRELQDLRRRVIGPVVALEADLKLAAEKLLTPEQLAKGPVPEPWTQIRKINWRTMWGLTILGILLIIGLFTRVAAVASAGLLSLFYLAAPPWPGVPEAPGPDHVFIVNKVYLEVLTLLALACLPSGRWFGIDALFAPLLERRRRADADVVAR